MLKNSSELRYENGEGSGSGGLYIINQVTLNQSNIFVFGYSYMDTICVVQADKYVLGCIEKPVSKRKKKRTDYDSVCSNILVQVNPKVCVPNFQQVIWRA